MPLRHASMTDARERLAAAAANPVWRDTLDPEAPRPPPATPAETDLLIVGGGLTGLWGALLALEADPARAVMLIEADRLGSGASGRAGGIVSPSVMHGLANAARVFPDDLAAIEAFSAATMEGLRAALARHAIAAEDDWGGEMTLAARPADLDRLATEAELHRRFGHDAVLLDRKGLAAEVAVQGYHGALWVRGGAGTINPGRLAQGLARAAARAGARLCEGTRLVRLRAEGAGLVAETSAGIIRARRVLLATGAWCAGLPEIGRRVALAFDRVIATRPLGRGERTALGWARRQGLYDTRAQLRYLRLTADDRLVFGGCMAMPAAGAAPPRHDPGGFLPLVQALEATFPPLAGIAIRHAWTGPIDFTVRMGLHLERGHDGRAVWVGGYSGFGIVATRAGAALALAALDRPEAAELALPLARQRPMALPRGPVRRAGLALTLAALDPADRGAFWARLWLGLVRRLGLPV